jgi:hypothetical protein
MSLLVLHQEMRRPCEQAEMELRMVYPHFLIFILRYEWLHSIWYNLNRQYMRFVGITQCTLQPPDLHKN